MWTLESHHTHTHTGGQVMCQESRLIIRGFGDSPLPASRWTSWTSRFLLELVISSAFVFRARTSPAVITSRRSQREGCLPNKSTGLCRLGQIYYCRVLPGPLRADSTGIVPASRTEGMRLSLEKSRWWLIENLLYGCPSRMIDLRPRTSCKFQVNTEMFKQLLNSS